jgi:cytochrome c553
LETEIKMSEAPHAPTDAPVTETVPSDRSWLVRASLFVGGFAIFGLILGLIIFPSRGEGSFDPFTAICRSLGIPGYEKIPADPGAATASAPVSNVAWTVETNRLLSHASATKGAALAKDTCGACHGEDGKSTDPTQFPNLAGQSQAAIFKELRDFQSGDRASDTMGPIAQALSEEQMADVAAYYAAQKPDDLRAADSAVLLKIDRLAREGDPKRGIPSCDSCHGPSRSGPEGTPLLLGQSETYIEKQLKNFSDQKRHNDIFERMRTIAHQLTPEEAHALAIYYHGMPTSN